MRSYTTPSVSDARRSVFWALLFILLLYLTAPALALLVKYEVYAQVVGSRFSNLPAWVHAWSAVDANLLDVVDINRDGIVQLGEIGIGTDVVVLAMPEIGGLLLRDLRARGGGRRAGRGVVHRRRPAAHAVELAVARHVVPRGGAAHAGGPARDRLQGASLLVAFGAAWVAARKPADILIMVSAAFSFAASSFFPAPW